MSFTWYFVEGEREYLARRVERLSNPEALEQEGMDACEALGIPGWNAAWTPQAWRGWASNYREAREELALYDLLYPRRN